MKKNIEVVLTPALLPLYDVSNKIVVVVDILRATSSICVAFAHGVERILPVATPEESMAQKANGFICAAERDGKVVDGFDMGNSPYSYIRDLTGKSIALTTTNGTHAIQISRNAQHVVVGSFLNLDFLCKWLRDQPLDIIVLCAGWKNKFNLEDTLFAGALVHELRESHTSQCDSAIAAKLLYECAADDLRSFIELSSHAHRFHDLGIAEDVTFCMQKNLYPLIPVLKGDFLVKMTLEAEAPQAVHDPSTL